MVELYQEVHAPYGDYLARIGHSKLTKTRPGNHDATDSVYR